MKARSPLSQADGSAVVDIASIIEARTLGWYAARLVFVSWLVTFFDGYDMNVIGFAAPYLAPAYHLDKIQLGNVFSAGIAGTLVGGFLFGPLGDRIGRRAAIIAATALFGVLTLALLLTSNYGEFMLVRFLDGIALGGAIPLTWALGTEYVPTKYRA
ncbi:MAG: MFS transporter, partial [Steroidobacteraceae bacterium]